MDTITESRRSWNMSKIRSRNTKPEMRVRSYLHRKGFRFRLHDKALPGCPDLVMRKYNTVVFVNGCFWHRHKGCKYAYTPKSKIDLWEKKFKENVERDKKAQLELKRMGWKVLTIWECQIKKGKMDRISGELRNA